MIVRGMNREMRSVIEDAEARGLKLEHGGAHLKLRAPDGRLVVTLSRSPSDHRAWLNIRARIRRALADLAGGA